MGRSWLRLYREAGIEFQPSLAPPRVKIQNPFAAELDGVPFVGIATFGEQGTFINKAESWHGNLMCSAVLF